MKITAHSIIRLFDYSIIASLAGCTMIPSVGPSYEEPVFEVPSYLLPDAGQPTTNLTETCEYRAAESNEDARVVISKDVVDQWWKRFNDPVLEALVEGGVSNNVGYLMAQKRLVASQYELLGSYAAFLPKFGVGAAWQRDWKNAHAPGGSGANGYAYNAQNVALDGNWEIDIFGGSRRASEAAFAMAEAAGWTVSDA